MRWSCKRVIIVVEYINTNAESLDEIMNWEYEWDFEEESVSEDK